jgi:hypothetical protein
VGFATCYCTVGGSFRRVFGATVVQQADRLRLTFGVLCCACRAVRPALVALGGVVLFHVLR